MTRDQAKQWLPILQAYSEGKVIQWSDMNGEWKDLIKLHDWCKDELIHRIRIKPPEPTYRPFKYEEVPIGSEFRRKDLRYKGIIIGVSADGNVWSSSHGGVNLERAFEIWELKKNGGWGPFGVLE